MCIYIYIYIYIKTHVSMDIYVYVNIYIYIYIYVTGLWVRVWDSDLACRGRSEARTGRGSRVQVTGLWLRVQDTDLESGPLREIHCPRHKWPGGLVN